MRAYNRKKKPKHTTKPRWNKFTARGYEVKVPCLRYRIAGSYSRTYWTFNLDESGESVRVKRTYSKNGYKSKARRRAH